MLSREKTRVGQVKAGYTAKTRTRSEGSKTRKSRQDSVYHVAGILARSPLPKFAFSSRTPWSQNTSDLALAGVSCAQSVQQVNQKVP